LVFVPFSAVCARTRTLLRDSVRRGPPATKPSAQRVPRRSWPVQLRLGTSRDSTRRPTVRPLSTSSCELDPDPPGARVRSRRLARRRATAIAVAEMVGHSA
jgi:hypothetical protein